MKQYAASFDLTAISAKAWMRLVRTRGLSQAEPTDDGWLWKGRDGFVETGCDPVTGARTDPTEQRMPGYTGSIGIEGSAEFVADVFVFIKEKADDIKAENFGRRQYG